MGIPGLLQFIKDASEPINVKKYKGQTVAVDTYCWLHKGAFSCAEKLAKGEPTDQYVLYCMKFVDMLLSFNVKPILVFDGHNLPSKEEVEKARRERRQANLHKGRQLLREGKLSEARDCFTRCVNITPGMAHNVIKAARTRGVDCIVAPYEADAQLAFLSKSGLAHAVITEDSDLLAFGCKKVILKMDKQGNGLEIDQSHLGRCRSLGDVFTEDKFRHMCILSGCDYLPSLHGIGLGKACKLLRIANNPDILKVIRKMGQYLKMSMVVPEEYVEGFTKANNTFLYQLVFDPVRRKLVPLNPYPDHIDPASLSYAGKNFGDGKGLQMALGNLDINTMERIDDFNPDKPITQLSKPRSCSWNDSPGAPKLSSERSIWSTDVRPDCAGPPRPAAPPDRPPSTRGKERVISLEGLGLPGRERQVKRSRENSGISDQEVLQQYSSCDQKRSRPEVQPDKPASSDQPRIRNCFATLLQRRNQDVEGDHQATRSRFFSSACEVASQSTQQSLQEDLPGDVESRVLSQTDNKSSSSTQPGSDLSPDTPNPPSPTSSTRPQLASQGLGLFRWSGSSPITKRSESPTSASGKTALQQFQLKKESLPWSTNTQNPPGGTLALTVSSINKGLEDEYSPPDSPPSQDSAYFSQSQPCIMSCHKEEIPAAFSFPSSLLMCTSIRTIHYYADSGSLLTLLKISRIHQSVWSTVAGLPRLKPNCQGKAAKVQVLSKARASGLRRKPPGPGKKANNENSPGLQATISGLWKNFGFKKYDFEYMVL
uniref:Exonuclease 1 n=1 Tax=Myripristis murdjan TaxID=586833 RepID=A0A668AS72_9TELE